MILRVRMKNRKEGIKFVHWAWKLYFNLANFRCDGKDLYYVQKHILNKIFLQNAPFLSLKIYQVIKVVFTIKVYFLENDALRGKIVSYVFYL